MKDEEWKTSDIIFILHNSYDNIHELKKSTSNLAFFPLPMQATIFHQENMCAFFG